MGDSRTDARTGTGFEANAETAALREQLTLALDRLAERERQLVEQERQLAELREKITLLIDRIRKLENLPKRPRMKPSGMASSADEDTDTSASDSSGSGRSGTSGKDRRKGRGPRRRNRHLHRRDVTVGLDDVPKGAVHKGCQDHTVRDIVFHAEEVTYRREVWQFPDGSRHVAPLPPGVATGREQYGPGVKALVIMLYYQCQSTIERIVSMLNDVGLDISARGGAVPDPGHRRHRRGAQEVLRGRHGSRNLDQRRRYRRPPQGRERLLYGNREQSARRDALPEP